MKTTMLPLLLAAVGVTAMTACDSGDGKSDTEETETETETEATETEATETEGTESDWTDTDGRPLLVARGALRAPLTSRSDWARA